MQAQWSTRLAGAGAGVVNGLFGGGGGMVLIPVLSRQGRLKDRQLFATSVAVILPVCAVSAAVYLFRGSVPLAAAAPYLVGGALGGILGGKTYGKVSTLWLRRLFAAFVLYGGVRYLL